PRHVGAPRQLRAARAPEVGAALRDQSGRSALPRAVGLPRREPGVGHERLPEGVAGRDVHAHVLFFELALDVVAPAAVRRGPSGSHGDRRDVGAPRRRPELLIPPPTFRSRRFLMKRFFACSMIVCPAFALFAFTPGCSSAPSESSSSSDQAATAAESSYVSTA